MYIKTQHYDSLIKRLSGNSSWYYSIVTFKNGKDLGSKVVVKAEEFLPGQGSYLISNLKIKNIVPTTRASHQAS